MYRITAQGQLVLARGKGQDVLRLILADSEHYRAALQSAAHAGYRWQRHIQCIAVYHEGTVIGEAASIESAELMILERVYGV
jgi:hypothetical protein